jgi:hypothetical protein
MPTNLVMLQLGALYECLQVGDTTAIQGLPGKPNEGHSGMAVLCDFEAIPLTSGTLETPGKCIKGHA